MEVRVNAMDTLLDRVHQAGDQIDGRRAADMGSSLLYIL